MLSDEQRAAIERVRNEVAWHEQIGHGEKADEFAHDLASLLNAFDSQALKLQGFQTRMTEMGYLDLDQLATVFYRNVNWLQAIQDALKRYRVSLTKTEAEAFRDLTAAIEQPPEAPKP